MSRRFRRGMRYDWAFWIVLVVVVLLRFWFGPASPSTPQTLEEGLYHVERAIDGDTLQLSGDVRVRLIGVNAPETVKPEHPVEPWGPEASAFTKQFVSGGTVRLQFDRERRDQYGRLLAYVWVGDTMLNEELVRRGLARYEPQYHYSEVMKRRFRAAQKQAQAERIGIWSPEPAGVSCFEPARGPGRTKPDVLVAASANRRGSLLRGVPCLPGRLIELEIHSASQQD